MENLSYIFLIVLGINISVFGLAYFFQTDRFTDITYVLSFIIAATFAMSIAPGIDTIQILLYILLSLWAIRLGTFLYHRIQIFGKDARFNNMRKDFKKYLGFWLLQSITVVIVGSPVFIALSKTEIENNELILIQVIGLLMASIGLIFEAIADQQKFNFKIKNKNNFIKFGLWKYSRHPNYLGEVVFWTGMTFATIGYLKNLEFILLISPIYIYLLLNYVSGVNLAEAAYLKKFEKDEKLKAEYQEYLNTTSKFFPNFSKLWKNAK